MEYTSLRFHYFIMSAKSVCDWLRLALVYRMTIQLEKMTGMDTNRQLIFQKIQHSEYQAKVVMDKCVGRTTTYCFLFDPELRGWYYGSHPLLIDDLGEMAIEQLKLSVLGKRGSFQSPLPPAKRTVVDIRQETNKMPDI